jgi:TonB family protein
MAAARDVLRFFLKLVLALIVLAVAYHYGTDLIRESDKNTAEVMSHESPWSYTEKIDPVTKNWTAKAAAQLRLKTSTGESAVVDAVWNCSDGTTETVELEISTFVDKTDKTDNSGNLQALEQDWNHAVDYRFDGVATSISSKDLFTGATIRREYRNSVQLFPIAKTGLFGRHRYPGLYILAGRYDPDDFVSDTKVFYIVDPEFVARIPTSGGANVVVQFSLEDQAIKKMLTQCGITYGPPPPAPVKNRNAIGSARTAISSTDSSPTSSSKKKSSTDPRIDDAAAANAESSQNISRNIRLDPSRPLKIGAEFYPDASKRAHEEGRCIVQVTVSATGMITNESIQTSSGFPRLDEACLKGVHGQQVIPAMENGKPVEKTVAIPIVWKLTGN